MPHMSNQSLEFLINCATDLLFGGEKMYSWEAGEFLKEAREGLTSQHPLSGKLDAIILKLEQMEGKV